MASRVLDWRSRLLSWADAQVGMPFRWGTTDCASLARGALAICFGRDVVPSIPNWRSARRATSLLRRHGSVRAVMLHLGAEQTTLAFARTGDVLVMPEPDESVGIEAVGVWLDGAVLLVSQEQGVHVVTRPVFPREHEVTLYSLWEIPERG